MTFHRPTLNGILLIIIRSPHSGLTIASSSSSSQAHLILDTRAQCTRIANSATAAPTPPPRIRSWSWLWFNASLPRWTPIPTPGAAWASSKSQGKTSCITNYTLIKNSLGTHYLIYIVQIEIISLTCLFPFAFWRCDINKFKSLITAPVYVNRR